MGAGKIVEISGQEAAREESRVEQSEQRKKMKKLKREAGGEKGSENLLLDQLSRLRKLTRLWLAT